VAGLGSGIVAGVDAIAIAGVVRHAVVRAARIVITGK
jgi:hypothetical protein